MTEPGRSASSDGGRRAKRLLSPSQKYEIWLGLLRGEFTTIEAAERGGVDRSTIVKLRTVAKQGALDALAASRPGVRQGGRTRRDAVRLMLAEKSAGAEWPGPSLRGRGH